MAKTTPSPLDAPPAPAPATIDQQLAALDDLDSAATASAPALEPAAAPPAPAPAPTIHTRDRDPAQRAAWKRERAIALGILKP